jgi:hypothetical protein
MLKGWLYDKRESDSGRRAKPRRRVVEELAYCLSVLLFLFSLTEAKDHRPARKGVNDQLAPPTM